MKLTTTVTLLAVLAALTAFVVTPAGAQDEPVPPPGPSQGKRAEMPAALVRIRAEMRALHMTLQADADHDGAVSAAEWKTFLAGLQSGFAALDKDGDGALSKTELPTPPPGMGGPGMHGMGGPGMHPPGMGGPGMGGRAMGGRPGMGGPGMGGPGMGGRAMGGRPGMGGRAMGGRPGMGGPGMGGRAMGGRPGMGGPGMGGRAMGGRPGMGGPGMGGRAMGGPGMAGHGMAGHGARPPQGARHGPDLGAKIDRLSSAIEKLLEQMKSNTPR